MQIGDIEERLSKNREIGEKLQSELRDIKSEKGIISSRLDEIDAETRKIEDEISGKSKHYDALTARKKSLEQKNKAQIEEIDKKEKDEEKSIGSKLKELEGRIAEKEKTLIKELEKELISLSGEKRKSIEKWRRMQIRAKIKLEEHDLKEELKKDQTKAADEKGEIEEEYKKSLRGINNARRELKQAINGLEVQKQYILAEKEGIPKESAKKGKEIQKASEKLDSNSKEREELESELSRLESELPKPGWSIFSRLKIKEKEQPPEKKTVGMSRNFKKYHKALHNAIAHIDKGNTSKAKKHYAKARDIYVGLDYHEKKDAYGELMELYNKLS